MDVIAGITDWISERVEESGAAGAVFGLSGGLDSVVVGALCRRALGDRLLGVIMPCGGTSADEDDARLAAGELEIPTIRLDLEPVLESMMEVLPPGGKDAVSNVKPRLHMTTLYYIAKERGFIVVGTSNKSERSVGYFTKYGDSGADIYPIADIYKTDLYEIAKLLGVPEKIIEKAPSAGLWEGQTDESDLGMSYSELDSILKAIESGTVPDSPIESVDKVQRLISSSEHKRQPVPMYVMPTSSSGSLSQGS